MGGGPTGIWGRGCLAAGFLDRLTMPGSLHWAQWVRFFWPAEPKLGTARPQWHLRDTTLTMPSSLHAMQWVALGAPVQSQNRFSNLTCHCVAFIHTLIALN